MSQIIFKRSEAPGGPLQDGEPGWAMASRRLFVGQDGENHEVGDGVFLRLGGGALSGPVLLHGNPSEDLHPTPRIYIDGRLSQNSELDLMMMNFQYVSWAQFAIFDGFDGETRRESPEPGEYPGEVENSMLTNGGDSTPARPFVFTSKTYADMTTIATGTGTASGQELTDAAKAWFNDEVRNLTCVDSADAEYNVETNTSIVLTLDGNPATGPYLLRTADPAYAFAFLGFLDSTNGGYGYTKLEASFDGGANWQVFLDTQSGIDRLGSTQAVAGPGRDYKARVTLTNDAEGRGAVAYNFLVATDPSPWRF